MKNVSYSDDNLKIVKVPRYIRPLWAMRLKCIDCCGGDYKEVESCTCSNCSLFAFRFDPRKRKNIKFIYEKGINKDGK